jgi:hypothetical protein
MMNFPQYDTIALSGLAPSSRDQIKDIAPDTAVFAIGAAHKLPALPRMDACLEIHPLWLLDHENYNPDLRTWLNEHHDFPVYMMEKYPGIPSAVRYPLEQVTERFLSWVCRGDEVNRFYTSSFDYLMGLALLHNPRRVEIYGYDMSTDTEYYYQREGASFWLGLAAGAGIEVVIPEDCPMLSSRMYAYEGTQRVTYARIVELLKQTRVWLVTADKQHDRQRKKLDKVKAREAGQLPSDKHKEMMAEYGRIRDDYFLKSGAVQALEQLRDKFSLGDVVARQEIERHKSTMQAKYITFQSKLNFWEGVTRDRWARYDENRENEMVAMFLEELQEAQIEQNKTRDFFFMHQGAVVVLQHLIAECDLQHEKDWVLEASTVEIKVDAIKDE